MARKKLLEQSIAVFGESGSGKTVLLSSFYGPTQEGSFAPANNYHVIADSSGQGNSLYRNYLGMRDHDQAPEPTRFERHTFSFTVKARGGEGRDVRVVDAFRLRWHDYPGEWFEQDVSGETEEANRAETFRDLLRSDVALLMVDGQQLAEHAGAEERYLKALFSNYRNSVYRLRDEFLAADGPLAEFPRIWIVAMSKADLLPEMDVEAFRDLMVLKAADEMEALREALATVVKAPEALSVGEDFLKLSSARFEPGRIDVSERIGVDLILPLAALLPLERHLRWSRTLKLPRDVGETLFGGLGQIARVAVVGAATISRLPPWLTKTVAKAGPDAAEILVTQVGASLLDLYDRAMRRRDYVSALLAKLKLDLERGEESGVLIRSKR